MEYFYKRIDIQKLLDSNPLNAKVYYRKRPKEQLERFITYQRIPIQNYLTNNQILINRTLIQVSYFSKKINVSIEGFMLEKFNANLTAEYEDPDYDYFIQIYQFEVDIDDEGWI